MPAPFSRRIAEPFDADATGQATFYCCFDKVGCEKGERDGHIDLPHAALLTSAKLSDHVLVVGHCLLKKSEQDSALKQDYSSAFELD